MEERDPGRNILSHSGRREIPPAGKNILSLSFKELEKLKGEEMPEQSELLGQILREALGCRIALKS